MIKHISKPSWLALIGIGVLCFFLMQHFRWEGNNGKAYEDIISSDGIGYYSYVPNLFIHKNIANQPVDDRYVLGYKDRAINKYYVGTAIAMTPFFGLGYLLADENQKKDGWSPPFQKAISLSGFFYLLLGLVFIRQLMTFYQIKEKLMAFILVLIVFSTNLLVYALEAPSMSHIYSFCFVSGFLYFSKKYITTSRNSSLFAASIFLGMIILIRPINGLVLLTLPFLAGSYVKFKTTCLSNIKPMLLAGLLLLSVIGIQLLMNHWQTGDLFVWNYKNEGFYFATPQLWQVLFGFRKGWFIYTPIAFIALGMLVFLIRKNRFSYGSLLLFFFIIIYITSSWWNWYYGPSFGQRPFVEFYGLIGLVLALGLTEIQQKYILRVITTLCLGFVGLNLIQSYQYNQKIISSWDMNFEKYRYTFLKTGKQYAKCLGGNNDIWLYKPNAVLQTQVLMDFQHKTTDGKGDFTNQEFNSTADIPVTQNLLSERGLFAEIQLDRKEIELNSCSQALVIIELSDSANTVYHYYKFKINETPDNPIAWKSYHYNVEIPKVRELTDQFKIYIWNKNKSAFLIDNFKVDLYSIH